MSAKAKNIAVPDISASAVRAIEEKFFFQARELLKDPAWVGYRTQVHGPVLAVKEFTSRYTDLLSWAFAEYVEALARALAVDAPKMPIPWHKVQEQAFQFVERFVTGAYWHPWTGDFLRSSEDWINSATANAEYLRLHEIAPWFSAPPDVWERVFFPDVQSGSWKDRAIENGKQKVRLIAETQSPAPTRKPKQQDIDVPPWRDLQRQKSIKQADAASYLRVERRTVRQYVRNGTLGKIPALNKTPNGRICCDGKLFELLRKDRGNTYH